MSFAGLPFNPLQASVFSLQPQGADVSPQVNTGVVRALSALWKVLLHEGEALVPVQLFCSFRLRILECDWKPRQPSAKTNGKCLHGILIL